MVPEDLLFWIAPLDAAPIVDANVLCQRHADAMGVPRGWTLDDRREDVLRLFRPRPAETSPPAPARRRSRPRTDDEVGEQLQIDGTGEIGRPTADQLETADAQEVAAPTTAPWEPEFDQNDDLGGLLEVTSPLLARAFRGTDRPKR